MKILAKFFITGFEIVFLFLILILLSDRVVINTTKNKIYTDISEIPVNKVGLLLGTAKYFGGYENPYYRYRINAAIALYKAGKISVILVSGDNGNKHYDEPTDIKNDLIAGGVPASKIILDYAGFRTLDSVVRLKKIFGQNKVTIISQEFHNQRAIFIAINKNIDAIGYNAKDVKSYNGLRIQLREKLARVKMFIDLLFGVKPKYLGEKIEIG